MKKNSRLLPIVLSLMAFAAVEAATYSGSLPVLYINTTGSAEITSTETYVGATCYIDALSTSYTSLGTAAAPIALQIKGRGNKKWTNYDKKPYRIKFTAKQKPLGMSDSNKHFVLIPAADDDLAFLRFPVGMRLSMLMELDYTPEYRPIEVVLNGDYIGFYIFAEKVRVGKNRVNITEQEDNETDPTMVTAGLWKSTTTRMMPKSSPPMAPATNSASPMIRLKCSPPCSRNICHRKSPPSTRQFTLPTKLRPNGSRPSISTSSLAITWFRRLWTILRPSTAALT